MKDFFRLKGKAGYVNTNPAKSLDTKQTRQKHIK